MDFDSVAVDDRGDADDAILRGGRTEGREHPQQSKDQFSKGLVTWSGTLTSCRRASVVSTAAKFFCTAAWPRLLHASLQLFKLSADVCDFNANRAGVLRSFLPKCLKLITKGSSFIATCSTTYASISPISLRVVFLAIITI